MVLLMIGGSNVEGEEAKEAWAGGKSGKDVPPPVVDCVASSDVVE